MNSNILVTGATGTNGQALLAHFANRGIPVRAMIRNKTGWLPSPAHSSVEPVFADFDDPATLSEALRGIDKAFLVTNSTERSEDQQLRFVEQARKAGVQHIVKLSQFAADINSPVRFLRYHASVEAAITQSGMAYSFLRPNLFMQGLLLFRSSIVQQGRFYAPIGDARVSLVDVRDIGEVAFACLTLPGHEGRIYNLTGPESLSHSDLAVTLSSLLSRDVQFVDVSEDALRHTLVELGMPEWQREGLIEDYAHYRRGEAAEISHDMVEVTGRPATSFAEFARLAAPQFLGPEK